MNRFLFLLIAVGLFACTPGTKNVTETVEAVIMEPPVFDSARDIIPDYTRYLSISEDSMFAFACKRLSIPDIRENIAAEQIRIWIGMSWIDSGRVITFAAQNNQWSANCVSYGFWNTKLHKRSVIRRRTDHNGPLRGWDRFLKKIDTLGLYREDQTSTSNCMDGNIVTIEWTHNNQHRRFDYHCPDVYRSSAGFTRLHAILREIEREFSFQVYPLDCDFRTLFPELYQNTNRVQHPWNPFDDSPLVCNDVKLRELVPPGPWQDMEQIIEPTFFNAADYLHLIGIRKPTPWFRRNDTMPNLYYPINN